MQYVYRKEYILHQNPIVESMVASKESKGLNFSFLDNSTADAGLLFVENEQTNRENDLLYHDLPDIGNFEDIDRLLR